MHSKYYCEGGESVTLKYLAHKLSLNKVLWKRECLDSLLKQKSLIVLRRKDTKETVSLSKSRLQKGAKCSSSCLGEQTIRSGTFEGMKKVTVTVLFAMFAKKFSFFHSLLV